MDFFGSLLLATLVPLGLVAFALLLSACLSPACRSRTRCGRGCARALVACANLSCCRCVGCPQRVTEQELESLRNLCIKAASILLNLCYPSISRKALEIFPCRDIAG